MASCTCCMTALLAVTTLLVALPTAAAAPTASGRSRTRLPLPSSYIVQLTSTPTASYAGGIDGLTATQAAPGQRLDPQSAAVQAYVSHLQAQATSVAAAAGVTDKVGYMFRYTVAGFFLHSPTRGELAALQEQPGVARVVRCNRQHYSLTYGTPRFLGLLGPGGAWQQLAGGGSGPTKAGEGTVIGVIDSGYWPEHPSFSDRRNPSAGNTGDVVYPPAPSGFKGQCSAGEEFAPQTCNRKVIACQYFSKGFAGAGGVKAVHPEETLSCRDANSHGSFVASIAAGNYGVVSGQAVQSRNVSLSGMAPRARLAVYKATWGQEGHAEGTTADILAAIEQAVEDKVDVINYSIGSDPPVNSFREVIMEAFMQATAAGIFVAAAGGNSAEEPVDNGMPWMTTVAASTHDRRIVATVRLGSGHTFTGACSIVSAAGPASLVLAEAVKLPNASLEDAKGCVNATLDKDKAQGKIVVCNRDGKSKLEKAEEVLRAEGAGMLLLNKNAAQDLDMDAAGLYQALKLPVVILPFANRPAVLAYAAQARANASFSPSRAQTGSTAPQMYVNGSTGPASAGDGAVLKPDITAPGISIFAANSPKGSLASMFAYGIGTSFAVPVISGFAALIKQQQPSWSPMTIKSAMMTTAYQTTITGKKGKPLGDAFSYGAGHVGATQFLSPGLAFDSHLPDWQRFLCGVERRLDDAFCGQCDINPEACMPYNLNQPSIALPKVLLSTSTMVKRTVTNMLPKSATFKASVAIDSEGSNPVRISVQPASFQLAAGKSTELAITFQPTSNTTEGGDWSMGSITWTSNRQTTTRIPWVARTSLFYAPQELEPSKSSLTWNYSVFPGFFGSLNVAPWALVPATLLQGQMAAKDQDANFTVNIPANTVVARFRLYGEDVVPFEADLDLFVEDSVGTEVGSSTSAESSEVVSLLHPQSGQYKVSVNTFFVPQEAAAGQFTLYCWIVASIPGSNMQAASPVGVSAGQPKAVQLTFSGLNFGGSPATKYLGAVEYFRGAKAIGVPTIVSIG